MIPEDREQVLESERIAREALTIHECEFRQRTPWGEIKWLLYRAAPSLLDDRSVVWDGVVIDITQRKRVEDSLASSDGRGTGATFRVELPLVSRGARGGEAQRVESDFDIDLTSIEVLVVDDEEGSRAVIQKFSSMPARMS
jgi:hypothetical protein